MKQIKLNDNVKVILASKSPRRRELLSKMGVSFEILTVEVEETYPDLMHPRDAVRFLAEKKARSVAELAKGKLIIASDTLVELDGKALGKPENKDDAYRMLWDLSGRHHNVHTGVCVIYGDQMLSQTSSTDVFFHDLSDQKIWDYIETGEPMDKAGAYAIQGIGKKLVSHINGDMETVIGFPTELVAKLINEIRYE